MPETKSHDMPLRFRLSHGCLTISIGVDTLAIAARNAPEIERLFVWSDKTATYDESRFRITDPHKFAEEVVRQLNDEEDDGSTMFTRMMDTAFLAAIENGAEGVEITDDAE